MNKELIGQL